MIELFTNVQDYRWLKRYLRFIETFKKDSIYKTHKHHILPKANYSKFSDFIEHPWNLAVLDYRSHLIAHYMLAKALGGNMWFAYNNMNVYGEKLNSILYESAMELFTIENSKKKVGTVCVKDGDKYNIVSKIDFDNNDNLVGVTKGLFIGDKNVSKRAEVRDKISKKLSGRIHCIEIESGDRKFIKENEFDENLYQKITPVDNSGFTAVKTEKGIERVTIEEFNQGQYEHFNKGKKRSQEFKDNLSKKMKGVKKLNTDNSKKTRILTNPNGEKFSFLGAKDLDSFCKTEKISYTILKNNLGTVVTELSKTNRPKLIVISKNTIGWKLEIL